MTVSSAAPWSLIMARVMTGFAGGGAMMVTPMYITEISDDSVRGTLCTFMAFINASGVLVGYILGGLLSFTHSSLLCLTLPIIHIISTLKMPETPPYLVKIGQQCAAAKSLAWLKSLSPEDKMVQNEIQKLVIKNEEVKNMPKISIQSILRDRASRRGCVIVFLLLSVHGWNGFIVVTAYMGTIFQAAFVGKGAVEDISPMARIILSNVGSSVMVGLLMLLGAFLSVLLVDKSGRKVLLFCSTSCCAISMATLGTWFYLTELGMETPSWLPVAALSLFVFSNVVGVGPLPMVIMAEVFSFHVRSTLSVLLGSWMWITAFIQLKVFKPLISMLGIHILMWILSAVSVFGAVYTVFGVPETKGRSLDDIAEELSGRSKKEHPNIVSSRL